MNKNVFLRRIVMIKDTGLVVLFICGLISFVAVLTLGINYLITFGILWVSNGIFNYDLSSKFWYVFVALCIVQSITGTSFWRGRK